MEVKDIMTLNLSHIRYTSTLDKVEELVAMAGVIYLMVIDNQNNFVGMLSGGDILRAALPDIGQILDEESSKSLIVERRTTVEIINVNEIATSLIIQRF